MSCRYVKIVPLRPADGQYNMSIWFVQLKGIDNEVYVEKIIQKYNQSKEEAQLKMCMKLFRKRRLNDCYETLSKSVNLMLESNLTAKVYKYCVVDGDFQAVIALLSKASEIGLFAEFIENSAYSANWSRLDYLDREFKYFVDNLIYEEYTIKTIREKGKLVNGNALEEKSDANEQSMNQLFGNTDENNNNNNWYSPRFY